MTSIIIILLGSWPIIGWELDIFTVIFLIMAVGLAVDYTVHLLHSYNESSLQKREDRCKECLESTGITVLSGAITTFLAAVPLWFATATFFFKFGIFVAMTIGLSILIAIFQLIPMLLVIGPQGSDDPSKGTFGDVVCFHWAS